MSNKFKRRSEYGKGWDGRSRVSDKTYKDNYDQIDWSSVNKKEDKKKMTARSIKGVCSELIAAKEFLKKGYYVARSIDPQCPFDLIVVNEKGKARLLDVKSISYRKTKSYNCKPGDTINRSISKKQKVKEIRNDYIILYY
jgi:hypothetical protein